MIRSLPLSVLLLLFGIASCYGQHADVAESTDGTRIHFKTFGSGAPLLVINGGPGLNSDGFTELARRLGTDHLAITYDQRGTGRSVLRVADSTTVTMALMIDDIEAIRKKLKVEKWSVLGHSFGGMLASYYATRYPEHINKLILSSSGGIDLDLLTYVQAEIDSKLSPTDLDSVRYWNQRIAQGDTSHHASLQWGLHLAPAYVVDRKYVPIIAERLTQRNLAIGQLIWKDLQRIHFDCADGLRAFTNPVLIIQGKQDIIREATAQKAHAVLADSKVVLLDHCIHYGWLDNEAAYFKEVNAFLSARR